MRLRFRGRTAFEVEIAGYQRGMETVPVAIHPGQYLKETLGELGVSQAELARVLGVSAMRVSHVVNGTRPVTAELALLFGHALGQTPEYWLNLQASYDLATARGAVE